MIGDVPIHPTLDYNQYTDQPVLTNFGISYRQWLIGMALQGAMANPNPSCGPNVIALEVFQQVDAILNRLESEYRVNP